MIKDELVLNYRYSILKTFMEIQKLTYTVNYLYYSKQPL